MPKAPLNTSALCAEFCTNVVCPSCALASAMSWLRHCCWRLECSSCQWGEKLLSCEDWSNNMASKRSKAGRHCERGKSLCCVCCRTTEHQKVKALLETVRVSVRSGYTATVLISLWACMKNSSRVNNLFFAVKPSRLLSWEAKWMHWHLDFLSWRPSYN